MCLLPSAFWRSISQRVADIFAHARRSLASNKIQHIHDFGIKNRALCAFFQYLPLQQQVHTENGAHFAWRMHGGGVRCVWLYGWNLLKNTYLYTYPFQCQRRQMYLRSWNERCELENLLLRRRPSDERAAAACSFYFTSPLEMKSSMKAEQEPDDGIVLCTMKLKLFTRDRSSSSRRKSESIKRYRRILYRESSSLPRL
jgi:hypothetical protein